MLIGNLCGSGAAPYIGPLDLVPGAVLAYGQRTLSVGNLGSGYATIQRDSDNATQNFNYDAVTGLVPVTDIQAFCGAANPFVKTWKDQSGNGYDSTQATLAAMPRWIASATHGRPALGSIYLEDRAILSGANVLLSSGAYTVFIVMKLYARQNSVQIFGVETVDSLKYARFATSSDGGTGLSLLMDASTAFNHEAGGQTVSAIPQATWKNNYSIADTAWTFGSNEPWMWNGVDYGSTNDLDSGSAPGSFTGQFSVGHSVVSDANMDGEYAEILFYNSIISPANRLAIRQNMAAYYGITLS
jgi:hypothetical protein